jgi:hypothetical protein
MCRDSIQLFDVGKVLQPTNASDTKTVTSNNLILDVVDRVALIIFQLVN